MLPYLMTLIVLTVISIRKGKGQGLEPPQPSAIRFGGKNGIKIPKGVFTMFSVKKISVIVILFLLFFCPPLRAETLSEDKPPTRRGCSCAFRRRNKVCRSYRRPQDTGARNIPVVGIVGTSIGSVIGGLYACGYTAQELEEILTGTDLLSSSQTPAHACAPARETIAPWGRDWAFLTPNLIKTATERPLEAFRPLLLPIFSLNTPLGFPSRILIIFPSPLPPWRLILKRGNPSSYGKEASSAIRASIAIPGHF